MTIDDQEIGHSKRERKHGKPFVRVYLLLAELGPLPVTSLVRRSSLHEATVLELLSQKEFEQRSDDKRWQIREGH